MIMIGISPVTAGAAGALIVSADPSSTNLGDWSRRVTRTATLDGGSYVLDAGFSHTDRTVAIGLGSASKAEVDEIKLIVETSDAVILTLPDGAYKASPQKVVDSAGAVVATFLITGVGELK